MASIPSRTVRRTPSDWLVLVRQQHDSGLSAAAFCRQHGLVYQSFVARRRQLAGVETSVAASLTTAATPPSLPGFVEIGVAEPNAAHERPPSEWLVELDLGDGMQLRIRSSH